MYQKPLSIYGSAGINHCSAKKVLFQFFFFGKQAEEFNLAHSLDEVFATAYLFYAAESVSNLRKYGKKYFHEDF